jgi:septum site-determining protein MinD
VTVETVLPLALADETILVSSPRVASVRDTMKTRDLTRQVGGSVVGVVFVRSGTGRSPDVDHIAEFLSVDLLGHVPEDSAVPNAQDVGLPVVVAESESRAAAAYRDLGDRIRERIDALGTLNAGALSAESLDRDGSGFAFVDRPTESDDEDDGGDEDGGGDANERRDDAGSNRRAVSALSRTTNGHADGHTNGHTDGPTRDGTDRAARGTDERPSVTRTERTESDTGATSSVDPDGRTDWGVEVGSDEPIDNPGGGTVGEPIDGPEDESDTAGRANAKGHPGSADVDEGSERGTASEVGKPADGPETAGHGDVEPTEETETTEGADVLDAERVSDATGTADETETADDTESTDDSDDSDDVEALSETETAEATETTGAPDDTEAVETAGETEVTDDPDDHETTATGTKARAGCGTAPRSRRVRPRNGSSTGRENSSSAETSSSTTPRRPSALRPPTPARGVRTSVSSPSPSSGATSRTRSLSAPCTSRCARGRTR